jgi:hypothetical protein
MGYAVIADNPFNDLLAVTAMTLVTAPAAHAAPYSGLKHACKYTYGVGDYQSVSYDGHTGCAEASGLIHNFTARAPARLGPASAPDGHRTAPGAA